MYPAASTGGERQSWIGRLSALSPVLSQSAEAHQWCREGECTYPAQKEKKQKQAGMYLIRTKKSQKQKEVSCDRPEQVVNLNNQIGDAVTEKTSQQNNMH